ncbi:MAG: cytochrome c biogenesis protein CcsA [Acidobacteria bacterium]|nr:cytochrome c biogenesis protein CcsA [Acidobacteriota bacterium]
MTQQVRTSSGLWLVALAVLAGASVLVSVGLVFFYAPVEVVMGVAQKIFYFHVPAAWGMYVATGLCAISSVVFLVTRKDGADAFAAAAGSVGLLFGILLMITGPMWARTAWGVWWSWEPRLTSALVLFLILAAYGVLRKASERSPGLARFAAALAVVGALDIPIIHLAVQKWRGNHPTVIGKGGGGITPEMGLTLGVAVGAFTILLVVLLALRYRVEVSRRELARLVAADALRSDGAAGGES